jgi:hypothetical protein
MATCAYKTIGCSLSMPCRRCRETTSRRNTSGAGYRIRTNAENGNYWTRRR